MVSGDELLALVVSNHHLRLMTIWIDMLYPSGERLKATVN